MIDLAEILHLTPSEAAKTWDACVDPHWMFNAMDEFDIPHADIVRCACKIADMALPYAPPGKLAPARAIEAAEAWIANPCSKTVRRAEAAAKRAEATALLAYVKMCNIARGANRGTPQMLDAYWCAYWATFAANWASAAARSTRNTVFARMASNRLIAGYGDLDDYTSFDVNAREGICGFVARCIRAIVPADVIVAALQARQPARLPVSSVSDTP